MRISRQKRSGREGRACTHFERRSEQRFTKHNKCQASKEVHRYMINCGRYRTSKAPKVRSRAVRQSEGRREALEHLHTFLDHQRVLGDGSAGTRIIRILPCYRFPATLRSLVGALFPASTIPGLSRARSCLAGSPASRLLRGSAPIRVMARHGSSGVCLVSLDASSPNVLRSCYS